MTKMQNVSFRSVEDLLEFIPAGELKIVAYLRKLIFDCAPEITEKLSYNVPFYKMNKGIFFIWPSSVLWGKNQTQKGVRFGFQQGYLLTDDIGYLDKAGRKQVCWRDYNSVKDIDTDLLRTYIFEAMIIDQQFGKKKK